MLTLEECIEYFETEAETSDSLMMPYEPRKKYSDDCKQMAEWLRELKAYREELPKEIKNAKVRQADALEANVKNENYNSHLAEYIKGYLCGLSYTEGIIAKILEEVNADDK